MLSVTWTSKTNWGFFRMFTQNLSGRLRRHRRVSDTDRSKGALRRSSPVGLPDVDRLWVVDTMLLRHVVQEVKEESDGDGRRTLCAEDGHKHVVYKLLQCPLEEDGLGQVRTGPTATAGAEVSVLPSWTAVWSGKSQVWPWLSLCPSCCSFGVWGCQDLRCSSQGATDEDPLPPHPRALGFLWQPHRYSVYISSLILFAV